MTKLISAEDVSQECSYIGKVILHEGVTDDSAFFTSIDVLINISNRTVSRERTCTFLNADEYR